jgi:two-component system OmpR family sensor kinase
MAETAERAKKIRRAVLQMTTMIEYLLNSSRLVENGAQLYYHPEQVDLSELLQEVCHLHREIAPRTPISQRLGTVGTLENGMAWVSQSSTRSYW